MPTVKDYIEQLQNLYKPDDVIAVHLWQVDDVLGKAEEMEVKLSKGDAEDIIETIHSHIDSEFGITWETIVTTIQNNTFNCEDCGKDFGEFYEYRDDSDYTKICEDCYNKHFATALEKKDKDWFFSNYDDPIKDYPNLTFLQEE